jgi:hypothetical protein
MKLVIRVATLAALIASCKGERAPAPAPGSAAGTGAVPSPAAANVETCQVGLRVFEHVTCKSAESTMSLDQARRTLAGMLDVAKKTGNADPRQLQIVCARMVQALVRDASSNGCSITLGEADRAQIKGVLDAWYAERTPVVATGSGASDVVIGRIAGVRDAMCACADLACLTRVDGQLDSIGTLPSDAPQGAGDLGRKLLDDVSRCEARIRGGSL